MELLAIVRLSNHELGILTAFTQHIKDEELHRKLKDAHVELALTTIRKELE